MRLTGNTRYSELREFTADLDADALRGVIRLLRVILYDRNAETECPLCTWDPAKLYELAQQVKQ